MTDQPVPIVTDIELAGLAGAAHLVNDNLVASGRRRAGVLQLTDQSVPIGASIEPASLAGAAHLANVPPGGQRPPARRARCSWESTEFGKNRALSRA